MATGTGSKSLEPTPTPLLTTGSSSTTTIYTSNPNSGFTLRRARFGDLSPAARTCSLAFWDDVLFGRVIHPHRTTYPADVDKYWYRRFVVDWWDWSHVFLVTTETVLVSEDENEGEDQDEKTAKVGPQGPEQHLGARPTHRAKQKEIVTGFAHWSRIAPSWRNNYQAGWGLAWWDPRRLLKPLTSLITRLLGFVSPNRAASTVDEDIIERSYDFLDHVWTGARAESWYLECLAVHPSFQNRGQGRALVAWGLERASKERTSASVIAADGKERFYQNCGFNVGPVARSGEGHGNPLRDVPGGLAFFRDKDGVQIPEREPGTWMAGTGVFDWVEWRKSKM
ncbi:hypothetical protein A1O3_02838 [Capronia epimyces CBS 606.96]|uniref:N-acetyltransferase domain-containing protein n=1 Tax=Capronia epimyces CBS 606.96 TaxID=1182542 RepID=W9YKJ8_9EURO|nr:uncharacterized protein A1O3_02838 [Capronia epimyces CBS 606.96]EXJ89771.1 hypothetical protein A1O3_02838 [Capronia epimyces CBS 606.96]